MSPAIAGPLRFKGGLQAIDLSPKFFTTNITCAILLSSAGGRGAKVLLFARVAERVGDTCSYGILGRTRPISVEVFFVFFFSSQIFTGQFYCG